MVDSMHGQMKLLYLSALHGRLTSATHGAMDSISTTKVPCQM